MNIHLVYINAELGLVFVVNMYKLYIFVLSELPRIAYKL